MSRPAWGAWIETCHFCGQSIPLPRSRPAWGAWIETLFWAGEVDVMERSRPAWGAWIETAAASLALAWSKGRAPHGARGLKLFYEDFHVFA